MAKYRLEFKPSVWKDLDSVPQADRRRILSRIESLQYDPRPPGCEKLSGRPGYRIRQGVYRIIYAIEDDRLIVLILSVGHRRDIYQR